jgi:hypothetical protein
LRSIKLDFNAISGRVPAIIGRLSNLEYLSIQSAKLQGSLPVEINLLTNLKTLNLVANLLTSALPNLSPLTNLSGLMLAENHFTGRIADSFTNLSSLGKFSNVRINAVSIVRISMLTTAFFSIEILFLSAPAALRSRRKCKFGECALQAAKGCVCGWVKTKRVRTLSFAFRCPRQNRRRRAKLILLFCWTAGAQASAGIFYERCLSCINQHVATVNSCRVIAHHVRKQALAAKTVSTSPRGFANSPEVRILRTRSSSSQRVPL